MRIGYVQFAPALADLGATLAELERLLPRCAQADLVVLPELCNSGYNLPSRAAAAAAAESTEDSVFISFLAEQCRMHGFHVVTGFNERRGELLYNSALLVGERGCLGVYRKLHLFLREKDLFEPGDLGLPVFQCGDATIGMLVCFDWHFPEVWRILALKGADIICHPSNLVLPGLAQRCVPVHALMNRVYIVTANRMGAEGDLVFTGHSIIAGPRGELLAQAPDAEPHAAVVEADPAAARDKSVSARNDVFRDRRPELYGGLAQGT